MLIDLKKVIFANINEKSLIPENTIKSHEQSTNKKIFKTAAVGAAGVAVSAVPGSVPKTRSCGDTDGILRLGFIGLGQQAMYLLTGYRH